MSVQTQNTNLNPYSGTPIKNLEYIQNKALVIAPFEINKSGILDTDLMLDTPGSITMYFFRKILNNIDIEPTSEQFKTVSVVTDISSKLNLDILTITSGLDIAACLGISKIAVIFKYDKTTGQRIIEKDNALLLGDYVDAQIDSTVDLLTDDYFVICKVEKNTKATNTGFTDTTGMDFLFMIPSGECQEIITNFDILDPNNKVLNLKKFGALGSGYTFDNDTTIEPMYQPDFFGDGTNICSYPLDGTTRDLNGNYNGVPTGITYTEGKFGKCAVLNGASRIDTGLRNFTSFTFSTWVKITATNTNQTIFGQDATTQARFYVKLSNLTSPNTSFSIYGTVSGVIISGPTLTIGSWYMITASYDDVTKLVKFWVNDVLAGSGTLGGNLLTTNSNAQLGCGYYNHAFADYCTGSVDNTRFFTRAITDKELSALYLNNGSNRIIKQELDTVPTLVTSRPDFFKDGSNIATYLFNGDAKDSCGNFNATATGITYTKGKFGQAAVFSGAPDASNIALKSWDGVGDFSISLWVSKDRALAGEAIFGRYNPSYSTGGALFGLITEVDGTWGFTNEYGTGLYVGVSGAAEDDKIPLNAWTNLIVTISGATVSLYTNGKLSAQSTSANWATGARVKSASLLYLGQPYIPDASTAHNMFNGKMDNVRIFNRALNFREVLELYNEQPSYEEQLLLVEAVGKTLTPNGNPLVVYDPIVGPSIKHVNNRDYFSTPGSNDYAFGTGDFTVEAWVNFLPSAVKTNPNYTLGSTTYVAAPALLAGTTSIEFTFTTGATTYGNYNRKAFGPYSARGSLSYGLRIASDLDGNFISLDWPGAAQAIIFSGGYKNRTAKIKLENLASGGSRLYVNDVIVATGTGQYAFNEEWGYSSTDDRRYAPGLTISNLKYSVTPNTQYLCMLNTTGGIGFGIESGNLALGTRATAFEINTIWTPTTGTLYHLAATRENGTMKLWINGVNVATKTNTKNLNINTGTFYVGAGTPDLYDNFYGCIQQLHIIKGQAKYTIADGNFTPPTKFNQQNNSVLLVQVKKPSVNTDNWGKIQLETVELPSSEILNTSVRTEFFTTDAQNSNAYFAIGPKEKDFGKNYRFKGLTTLASSGNPSSYPTGPFKIYSWDTSLNDWKLEYTNTNTYSTTFNHVFEFVSSKIKIAADLYVFVPGAGDFNIYDIETITLTPLYTDKTVSPIALEIESEVLASEPDFFNDKSNLATYLFDNNVLDAGGKYPGTATNISYGVGKFGTGINKDVANGEFKVDTGLTLSNFTVSMWFKRVNLTDNLSFLNFPTLTNMLYLYGSGSGSKVSIGRNTISETQSTTTVTDLNWHHIVMSYDFATAKASIWLDGVATNIQNTIIANMITTPSQLTLFVSPTTGCFDNVRIFNRTLTLTEIKELGRETKRVKYKDVILLEPAAKFTIDTQKEIKLFNYQTWTGTDATKQGYRLYPVMKISDHINEETTFNPKYYLGTKYQRNLMDILSQSIKSKRTISNLKDMYLVDDHCIQTLKKINILLENNQMIKLTERLYNLATPLIERLNAEIMLDYISTPVSGSSNSDLAATLKTSLIEDYHFTQEEIDNLNDNLNTFKSRARIALTTPVVQNIDQIRFSLPKTFIDGNRSKTEKKNLLVFGTGSSFNKFNLAGYAAPYSNISKRATSEVLDYNNLILDTPVIAGADDVKALVKDSYTELLIRGSLTDQTGKTVTVGGNASLTTTQKKFNTNSIFFDGSGDYLRIPSTNFNFGSGDFTIECWVNPRSLTTSGYDGIITHRYTNSENNFWCIWQHLDSIYFEISSSTGATDKKYFPISISDSLNKWVHIAVVRENNNIKIYKNGILTFSDIYTLPIYFNNSIPIQIGALDKSDTIGNNFYGYIDDIRISKGIARYTSNFAPEVSDAFKDILTNYKQQIPFTYIPLSTDAANTNNEPVFENLTDITGFDRSDIVIDIPNVL